MKTGRGVGSGRWTSRGMLCGQRKIHQPEERRALRGVLQLAVGHSKRSVLPRPACRQGMNHPINPSPALSAKGQGAPQLAPMSGILEVEKIKKRPTSLANFCTQNHSLIRANQRMVLIAL